MRKFVVLALLAALVAAVPLAMAQKSSELNNPLPRHFPTKARFAKEFTSGTGGGPALNYHGGAVLPNAHVVPIYWGPSWNKGSDSPIALSLTNFISGFGTTGEYNTISQYYELVNGSAFFINESGLLTNAIYDKSTPPTNVTDADIQAEVTKWAGTRPSADTIYEVFLPATSYSSFGPYTSCGGPNLFYCAYHGNYTSSRGVDVKYASIPYPSCGGCQSDGFSVSQNLEHFVTHETREAVTDPDGTAWFDSRGFEADDKCAWNPTPFTDASTGTNQDGTPFAYQYEWSNADNRCVQVK